MNLPVFQRDNDFASNIGEMKGQQSRNVRDKRKFFSAQRKTNLIITFIMALHSVKHIRDYCPPYNLNKNPHYRKGPVSLPTFVTQSTPLQRHIRDGRHSEQVGSRRSEWNRYFKE